MRTASVAPFAGTIGFASVHEVSAVEPARRSESAVTYKEKVLYSFGQGGQEPLDGVIKENGTLYGTTYMGGGHGLGSVFALDLNTGGEKVLHSFDGTDGVAPEAPVIDVKGVLYGTTHGDDDWGPATVFSFDLNTGGEKTVHSFTGNGDGYGPTAGLIDIKGTLYGTTIVGGAYGYGTVFSLDPTTGTEKVLYSFCPQQSCADGSYPSAGLISVKNVLYGTTANGGGTTGCGDGCGTVFSINRKTGSEIVLYSFCSQINCADGASPYAGLIDVNGVLYGTTEKGGGATGCGNGCGTVFSLDPNTGAETVLYSFLGGADGADPSAGLISVNGILYGTTGAGGGTACNGNGCGTVFSLDPSTGIETVLYSFCSQTNCADGEWPQAGLLSVNGKFYGTTFAGGSKSCGGSGCGTVFMLKERSPTEREAERQ